MADVELRHLEKVHPNGVAAVRDLNLEIAEGEFVVLVGPSGCGKSTTLRMIAGLEEPTAGEIYIGGRRVNDDAPGDRDIAMVFQNYALYPHMTVFDNLAFGLRMRRHSQTEIAERVAKAAEILSIEKLLVRRPRELSGGQRQRVALGRAIVREPKVFLFDEPLSNLDATLRVQTRAEIAQLHRRLCATIVYVTHDQIEAMTLGDRLVLMNHGVVQQVDTPMNVYHRPVNRFVASFIGSPAMNFFPGHVARGAFHIVEGETHRAQPVPLAAAPEGPAELGVRPEDLLVEGEGVPLGAVTIEVVEHLGHETMAHFQFAGTTCIVRLPAGARVEPGQSLELRIRPAAIHLFAADDGRRLN